MNRLAAACAILTAEACISACGSEQPVLTSTPESSPAAAQPIAVPECSATINPGQTPNAFYGKFAQVALREVSSDRQATITRDVIIEPSDIRPEVTRIGVRSPISIERAYTFSAGAAGTIVISGECRGSDDHFSAPALSDKSGRGLPVLPVRYETYQVKLGASTD